MASRKLRYVPGLISLIGLPILFFIFPIEDPKEQSSVIFHLPKSNSKKINAYTEAMVHSNLKRRKITRIYFNPIEEDRGIRIPTLLQNQKLELIYHQLQQLSFTGDTTKGLQVEFGPDNTLNDWMTVRNMASINGITRYAFMDNSYYFFANPPTKSLPINEPELVSEFYPEIIDLHLPQPKIWTEWDFFVLKMQYKWELLVKEIKDNLTISLGFRLLIVVPWLVWLRRKKQVIVLS